MIRSVELYRGGYPASLGRYAGAIVSAELEPSQHVLRAEGNVRLFDAGAFAEIPFADGKGSAMVAGRYSYTAALSLIDPMVNRLSVQ